MSEDDPHSGPTSAGRRESPDPNRIRSGRGRARATQVAGTLDLDRTGEDRGSPTRGVRSKVLLGSMSLSQEGNPPGQDPTTGGTVLLGAARPGEEHPRPEGATLALWRRLMALPSLREDHRETA